MILIYLLITVWKVKKVHKLLVLFFLILYFLNFIFEVTSLSILTNHFTKKWTKFNAAICWRRERRECNWRRRERKRRRRECNWRRRECNWRRREWKRRRRAPQMQISAPKQGTERFSPLKHFTETQKTRRTHTVLPSVTHVVVLNDGAFSVRPGMFFYAGASLPNTTICILHGNTVCVGSVFRVSVKCFSVEKVRSAALVR